MGDHVGDRAVVLGASMGGLLAARVLAESYAEVLVVDRDHLTGVTTARRGVPQGRHVHGLLARGQEILEELFPGFTEEMISAGVPTADLGELRWYFNGKRLKPGTTGCICISAARPVLEAHVRTRLAALPNVTFMEQCDIVGLVTTPDSARVTGVTIRESGAEADTALTADLVVDATGRASRMPTWLEELGYERPDEDRIKIRLTYTSRHYRLPDNSILRDDLAINPVSSPSHPRGGFLVRIEGNRCILSLTGVLGDSAPTDEEGFLDFVKSLPVPDIYNEIKDAEPLDEPASFHYPASVRRHYERLTRFPEGLLVIGDAACSFNPVYGQGMTVSAQEAITLRTHLRKGTPPQARSFFKDISAVIEVPWGISAGGDTAFPEVEAPRPFMVRMMNSYMAKLQAAATQDSVVTKTFMRVAGLIEPPTALMRPGMMYRVFKGRKGAPVAAAAPVQSTEPAASKEARTPAGVAE